VFIDSQWGQFESLKVRFRQLNTAKALAVVANAIAFIGGYDLFAEATGIPKTTVTGNLYLVVLTLMTILYCCLLHSSLVEDLDQLAQELQPFKLDRLNQVCQGYEYTPVVLRFFGLQVPWMMWLAPRFHVVVKGGGSDYLLTYDWYTDDFRDNKRPWIKGTMAEMLDRERSKLKTKANP
jgi:hypothetical protein